MPENVDPQGLEYRFNGGTIDASTARITALALAVNAGVTFLDTIKAAVAGRRQTIAQATATMALDTSLGGVVDITLTASVTSTTITTANLKAGDTLALIVRQDATGSRTVVWPTVFRWTANTPPVLTVTALAVDTFELIWDGTRFRELNRSLAQVA